MFASRLLLRSSQRLTLTATRRCMSTSDSPPLLLKLRSDLKDAMRSKNQAKLDTLRSLLSAITNSSKNTTSNAAPIAITKDTQILALIHKQVGTGLNSIVDFKAAGRVDLVERETKQLEVLREYAQLVPVYSLERLSTTVAEVVEKMKESEKGRLNPGIVMRNVELVLEEGEKGWERAEVMRLIKDAVGTQEKKI